MKLALLLFLAFASTAGAFEKALLPPIDEAKEDASFVKFRKELKEIVRAKDWKRLRPLLSVNIEFTFGAAPHTPDAFAEEWKLKKDPTHSKLWRELITVLDLGGAFVVTEEFEAPYVGIKWPEGYDFSDYLAVVEKGPLFEKASRKSSQVTNLDYELVALSLSLPRVKDWEAVTTADGKTGYVPANTVRSPTGYRARFKKLAGHWLMISFIAGD